MIGALSWSLVALGATRGQLPEPAPDGVWPKMLAVLAFAFMAAGVFLAARARRAALHAQKESEDRLRLVTDNLPGSYVYRYVRSPGGPARFLYVSAGVHRVHGLTVSEVLEHPARLFGQLDPAFQPAYDEAEARSRDALGEFQVRFAINRRDGERRWLQLWSKPSYDPQGTLYWDGFALDVTDQHNVLTNIQRLHQRNDLILSAAAEGILGLDAEGRHTFVNPAAARLLGFTAEELIDQPAHSLWHYSHPDGRPFAEGTCPIHGVLHGGLPGYASVACLWRKDGHRLPVELTTAPIIEAAGVTGAVVTFRDVSGRLEAEEALRQSETEFRAMFELASVGMAQGHPTTGCFLRVNQRMCSLTGYTAEELVGRRILDITHPEDRDQDGALFRQVVQGEAAEYRHEKRYVRKDGTTAWVNVNMTLVRDSQGRPLRTMATVEDVTNRKQAEAALRASEERFRSTLDNLLEGFQILDRDWRYVYLNEAVLQQARTTRAQLLGRTMMEVYPGIEHSPLFHTLNRCRQERTLVELDNEFTYADGEHRWYHLVVQPVPEGLCIQSLDITERRRAERRARQDVLRTELLLDLHQMAAQLGDRELFDHVLEKAVQLTESTIGFFHQVSEDQKTIRLTTWNQGALRSCTAVFDDHYPLDQAGNWADCVREKRPIIYNNFTRSPHQRGLPQGHTPLLRFMSIPVVREDKVRIIFGVGNKPEDYDETDLTQLQIVSNELHKIMVQRASDQNLRLLSRALEQSPASVIIRNAAGLVEYVNPKLTQSSGYTLDQVRGQRALLPDFQPPGSGPGATWPPGEVLEGREWRGELRSRSRAGAEYWELAFLSSITDPGGQTTHVVEIREDITERKKLGEQLRRAQKVEAIGQLAGGVAHDFNNILAAIMMHVELLQSRPGQDAETRQGLAELHLEAQRAATLTRQLLMFSRRSVLAMGTVDLNLIVTNLLKMLSRLIGENIELRFEGQAALPSVEADPGMMEQVIMNFVVNARDAMPRGGRITLSTGTAEFTEDSCRDHQERRPGKFVSLAVADNGCGMEPAILQQIFDPFFTTKEAGKGTGLGLATVHGIVAQHKGWVEVESSVGQGSTFRVLLPALARTAPEASPARPAAFTRGGNETILLVEDEARVRKLGAMLLRRLGYRVYDAPNGQEAMVQWQQHGPEIDLLFTDMVMPEGITGLELAQRLQADKPRLKIIISSGYNTEMVQAGVPTSLGVLYLPKPYEAQRLAKVVRELLDRQSR